MAPMFANYRHWLDRDPEALAMLLILISLAAVMIGVGVVTLLRCSC
jgi:hypothetical protein